MNPRYSTNVFYELGAQLTATDGVKADVGGSDE
jgi:hypothetical protein